MTDRPSELEMVQGLVRAAGLLEQMAASEVTGIEAREAARDAATECRRLANGLADPFTEGTEVL